MSNLKPLSTEAIPAALEKAMRYRLLNEPGNAESICLDVLHLEPDNQQALVSLLLAMTDRADKGYAVGDKQIKEVLTRITDEYERIYYSGIVAERNAKAQLRSGTTFGKFIAYDSLREAMTLFERAEAIRPHGNDDAILRWNTCARMIRNNQLTPRQEVEFALE